MSNAVANTCMGFVLCVDSMVEEMTVCPFA